MRRAHGLANQSQLEAAGLRLDEQRQCVCLNGADVDLTAAEFRLLRYFMLHPGQVLSKGTWPSICTTARPNAIPTSSRSTSTTCGASSAAR